MNLSELKEKNIRLFQFAMAARAAKSTLLIDQNATNESQVGFFLRTKEGKADRDSPEIGQIVSKIESKYVQWDGKVATLREVKKKRVKKVVEEVEIKQEDGDELLN